LELGLQAALRPSRLTPELQTNPRRVLARCTKMRGYCMIAFE